jgi:4-amino-4-deoxy-L-arabinose transferase-like glycosyltransferase
VRSKLTRYWPAVALALLVPIWLIGLFGRGIWSPDEPREFDIAYNMLRSGDLVVPQLAGAPFVEKPPLAYWVQSASMRLFGPSIAAARLPNLLWAALAVLSIGALAGDAAGERNRHRAALIAAIACGSAVLVLQAQIWLATDAPLVAFTAVALLSGWRLAHADTRQRQLAWSLLFGSSLASALLAKNGFGLLVPTFATVTWLAWERQLHELRRWPWWVAAATCALVVGAWLVALTNRPGGGELLRTLLWDNLVTRLLPVQSRGAYDLGHESSHWKFLLLLPVYVLPWTFAMLGAGRWLREVVRHSNESGQAVRYCVSATVPACVVLLLSRTARGVYFAPALLCVPVLLALWLTERWGAFRPFEQTALRLTRYTLLMLVILFTIAATWLLVMVGVHSVVALTASALIAFVFIGTALSLRASASPIHALVAATLLFFASLVALQLVAFPVLDRSQSIAALIAAAEPQLRDGRVAVYCGDETTRATLDYLLDLRPPQVCGDADARLLLSDHSDQRFLVLLAPPRTAQRFEELFPGAHLPGLRTKPPRGSRSVADLARLGLQPIACWSVPGGRKYALYGRSPQRPRPAASCPRTISG